jgi:protocatechuate 3,4-dioxygenase alpha subunit
VPGLTPFQTVGPYFDILLRSRRPSGTPGHGATDIVIEGRLLDGAEAAVPDGLIETWQADAAGRYPHPEDPRAADAEADSCGYAWCHTDQDGWFRLRGVRPGAVPGPDGRMQAPHILVSVMARGILTRYITRMYFDGDPANDRDPILALVPEPRRGSLMARPGGDGRYRFDIVLQGPGETVFLDA